MIVIDYAPCAGSTSLASDFPDVAYYGERVIGAWKLTSRLAPDAEW